MIVGDQIWVSLPNHYDQLGSNVDVILETTSLALSIVTNAIATMMIAYKLWYVAVGGCRIHWIQWLTMQ